MKKTIAGILALSLILTGSAFTSGATTGTFVPVVANAEKYDELSYTVKNDGTIKITDCAEDAVSVEIPDKIDGKPVTSISDAAFGECIKLKSVNIPESVTEIGEFAFNGCESLESIVILDGATKIGGAAFQGCLNLKSVNIPDGITEIGEFTFCGCESLESIKIPESVTNIGGTEGATF